MCVGMSAHTRVCTGMQGRICCLHEIYTAVQYVRGVTSFPARLVLGDPVPLGLQGVETVAISSWCQACP